MTMIFRIHFFPLTQFMIVSIYLAHVLCFPPFIFSQSSASLDHLSFLFSKENIFSSYKYRDLGCNWPIESERDRYCLIAVSVLEKVCGYSSSPYRCFFHLTDLILYIYVIWGEIRKTRRQSRNDTAANLSSLALFFSEPVKCYREKETKLQCDK